tara:strand:- start:332 stop:499 length:168 start_codon:yes stop_codon:yes gene_type:complete
MNNNRFTSSDQSTLKQYYRSCAKEALERKDKREYKRYEALIKEMEKREENTRKGW